MKTLARLGLAGALAIACSAPDAALAQDGRPTAGPTEVEFAVVLLDLERIDDAEQGFSASVLFAARWNDPRLAHGGDGVVHRDLGEVWHPRLEVVNRRQMSLTLPQVVDIAPDGTVLYRQRVVGQFSQRLDLADFPLDRQTFAIHIVAVGYTEAEVEFVDLGLFPSAVVPELSISDWSVTGSRAFGRAYQPLPVLRPTAGFVLEFDARRHAGYYVSKIILPLLLIVAMSWLVFWFDADLAAPRISVAVTSMLTLIAYRFMVGGMLPKISYLTRMDLFTTAATILVFLTLIEGTAVVMLAKRGRLETARRVDLLARWFFPLSFAAFFVWAFLI